MKRLLKSLRNNSTLNSVVRQFYGYKWTGEKFRNFLRDRWRVSGIIAVKCGDYSFKMFSKADDLIADQLFYGNFDEQHELSFFSEYSSKSRVILDIGANTGLYSMIASLSNEEAVIHSFEPHQGNFDRLEINLKLNDINNVIMHKIGLGAQREMSTFYVPAKHNAISQVCSVNSEFSRSHSQNDITEYTDVKIQIESLDNLREQGLPKPDLIKIDVESHEEEVLKGMWETLNNDRPVLLIELRNSQTLWTLINQIVMEFHYKLFVFEVEGLREMKSVQFTQFRNYLLMPII